MNRLQIWCIRPSATGPRANEFEVYATTFVLGSDPISGEHLLLVEQPFHLGPLLAGELDAGQALIYNWYGRLLGETNPATGELYQESDLNLIDMNDIDAAMLQDHIIARRDWLASDDNEDIAIAFLRATLRGWIYCRDQADDCVRILLEIDPALGESHQRWQMNEVNKLIWPAPEGIGMMDGESLGSIRRMAADFSRAGRRASAGRLSRGPAREGAGIADRRRA